MAVFRKLHVSFWSDSYVQSLTPEKKYFFLYLLTNEKTTQLGVYEITKKQIVFDTGYSMDTVCLLLKEFEKDGKIMYSELTNEIALKNWQKYNENNSPKVQVVVNKDIKKVKDVTLIEFTYSRHTV